MTLNKRCINCELLLEPKQSDFCSQECEQEYKEACDQELLASLQPMEPKMPTDMDILKTQEKNITENPEDKTITLSIEKDDFSDLLTNKKDNQ